MEETTQKRSHEVTIRLSDEEHEKVKVKAKENGLKPNSYAKMSLFLNMNKE